MMRPELSASHVLACCEKNLLMCDLSCAGFIFPLNPENPNRIPLPVCTEGPAAPKLLPAGLVGTRGVRTVQGCKCMCHTAVLNQLQQLGWHRRITQLALCKGCVPLVGGGCLQQHVGESPLEGNGVIQVVVASRPGSCCSMQLCQQRVRIQACSMPCFTPDHSYVQYSFWPCMPLLGSCTPGVWVSCTCMLGLCTAGAGTC